MVTTKKSPALWLIFALAVLLATAGSAHAELLGKFDDWEAHHRSDGGAKVCYAATVPMKSEGDYTRRGNVYLLVSFRPSDNMMGFVSIEAGYAYAPDGKISALIGGTTHDMFADGELAFAFKDKPLVDDMIRGRDMIVKGRSSRGTLTTDTFSLSGFTAAYNAAAKACGAKE